ncbi:MAG: S9 family peptidase, partial [Sphingomonas sp.]
MKSWIVAVTLVAAGFSTQALGAPDDAAAKFGAREDIQQISLSPDGKTLAFIEPKAARGASVFVVSVDGGAPQPILSSSGDPDRLSYCRWSTNTRLVCGIY